MTSQQLTDDEYTRRAQYLNWARDAFVAAPFAADAVRSTYAKLTEAAQHDPVARPVAGGMFIWISRWWNSTRVDAIVADRRAILHEINDEVLLAEELAAL